MSGMTPSLLPTELAGIVQTHSILSLLLTLRGKCVLIKERKIRAKKRLKGGPDVWAKDHLIHIPQAALGL